MFLCLYDLDGALHCRECRGSDEGTETPRGRGLPWVSRERVCLSVCHCEYLVEVSPKLLARVLKVPSRLCVYGVMEVSDVSDCR